MIAIEHERQDIISYLLDTFPEMDLEKQDSKNGNTSLHIACYKNNVNVVQRIYSIRPRLCLKQNFSGETAFHITASTTNIQILEVFLDFKVDCLLVKDA